VLNGAHGVMLTSATLRDRSDAGDDWDTARPAPARRISTARRNRGLRQSFDYANQAEVLIVTDVPRGDIPALAAAYGRLIEASGGGVLGLFTAIRRLRAVHGRIADRLARGGLPLYAQHVDPIDTGTLVDIFRDDPGQPAGHRRPARRGGRARPVAAPGGDGAGALAQAHHPPPRPPRRPSAWRAGP
jgi:ATP-dependent DNA helicase DinG